MAITLPVWLRNYFQRSSYQSVSNNANEIDSNDTLPGAYPLDTEPIQEQAQAPPNPNIIRLNRILNVATTWINYFIIHPIIIMIIITFRVLSKLLNVIYFNEINTTENTHDAISKVNKFILNLEDNISSATTEIPPFFQGSYTQALYMATQRGKFLFVYLTNPSNEYNTNVLNNIVVNPKFIRLFKENPNDIIIWGGDLKNPESYQLANSLNVTKFPFLGLLCLTRATTMTPEGPKKTPSKISLIAKLQGNVKPHLNQEEYDSIIENKFVKKITKYEGELKSIKLELQNKYMSQVILKQQELNYKNSLMKDQLKKQQKNYEKLHKEFLIYNLPEYKKFSDKDNCDTTDVAKIAIKLKNGERISTYFPSSLKIKDIFIYLDLYLNGYFNNNNLTSNLSKSEAETKFKDLVLKFNFNLVSPLPPRITLNQQQDDVIKECNFIYPNGILIIE